MTGTTIKTATAGAGYAYAKVFAGMEQRAIEAVFRQKQSQFVALCLCVGSVTMPSTTPQMSARQDVEGGSCHQARALLHISRGRLSALRSGSTLPLQRPCE
ncbi:hypothetical protein IE4872_PA00085 (plasmid) [Rhizobium gallicum]|uniref:Uncharacterized protein n=1 Tax=Rhizobium gallicum TaxID=56730 RepID=A0A1L5NPK6_9HYPH|nr:hypothetical protein IE4872_PA00085 [Rhizobium gallicum]